MKGSPKVIERLNVALYGELTAINQYFLHSRMLKDWGLDKLGDYEYEESIDEMKHADKIIERILFLEGLPNLQDIGKIMIGENVKEILECDLKLEIEGRNNYRESVKIAEAEGDYASRDLFAEILKEEEGHIDFLETQLSLIDRIGVELYQQQQMSDKPGHG